MYLGVRKGRVPETSADIVNVDIDRMCTAVRLSHEDLIGMLLKYSNNRPIPYISIDSFQCCLNCTTRTLGLELRHWRFAWSMTCEVCGGLLKPARAVGEYSEKISNKLQNRAVRGAQVLRRAYEYRSQREERRTKMVLQIADVLYSDLCPTTITSPSQFHRFTLLAAIGMSVSRPLLLAALDLRKDVRVADRLYRAFPYQRRALRAALKVSVFLNERLSKTKPLDVRHSRTYLVQPISEVPQRYVMAMQQAIEHLGEEEPHYKLMEYAAAVLNRSKTDPNCS